MSKFSLFTLFLSATVVIIVAELLVNDYVKPSQVKGQVNASVLQSDVASTSNSSQTAADTEAPDGLFNFSVVSAAGFKDVSLQRTPFNGVLFESIDLRDFKSVPVTVNNLLQNNRKRIATFYEFSSQSPMLGKEVFTMLKEKSGKLIGATINPSNEFGEGSFFINYVERPEFAFLVVNGGDNVYALTYLKELHPLVKNVLAQISKPVSK
jgi:hypothetical protein